MRSSNYGSDQDSFSVTEQGSGFEVALAAVPPADEVAEPGWTGASEPGLTSVELKREQALQATGLGEAFSELSSQLRRAVLPEGCDFYLVNHNGSSRSVLCWPMGIERAGVAVADMQASWRLTFVCVVNRPYQGAESVGQVLHDLSFTGEAPEADPSPPLVFWSDELSKSVNWL